MRDSQRSKVYKAESKAIVRLEYEGLLPKLDLSLCKLFIEVVMTDSGMSVMVTDGRGRRSGVCRNLGENQFLIALPKFTRHKLYLLHECAHAISKGDKHGPNFCRVYVDLVAKFLGKRAARELAHHFLVGKVKVAT